MQNGVRNIYINIHSSLIKLIPENWTEIYLYASVVGNGKGEMYFYYMPKKIIKANPINCSEVPARFGIAEEFYSRQLKELYGVIKFLHNNSSRRWTNVTIVIKEGIFTIEYHYNNLLKSKFSDEQRRIVWCHKYLHTPIESLSVKNRKLINTYREEAYIEPTIVSMNMRNVDLNDDNNTIPIDSQQVKNQILKL